jgi:hypothetical protein
MNDLRKAAQQVLEAMDYMLNNGEWYQAQERADALRSALAQPEQEPAAWRYALDASVEGPRWIYIDQRNPHTWLTDPSMANALIEPLYIALPQRKPLRRGVNGVCTRRSCECEREGLGDQCIWLEKAHGIGGEE